MVSRIRILMHRRERIRSKRSPRTWKSSIMSRWSRRVSIPRRIGEMVLIRRPKRSISMLLEFYKRALRNWGRGVRFVRCWRSYMTFPGHRRGTGRVFRWAPKRGTQICEIQRREAFILHFDEIVVLIVGCNFDWLLNWHWQRVSLVKHASKTHEIEVSSSLSYQERKEDAQNWSFLDPFFVEKQDCLLRWH